MLPTWRFDGRWASTVSPATGASRVTGAKASIKASSWIGSRFDRRRAGAAARIGAALLVGERSAASRSRGAEALGSSRSAGDARFGPARRACQAPCATTPARTMPPSDARATVRLFNRDLRLQAASARRIAPGMSTVTMRETPCSCIVTPISCSAISMAMRLWLMKRNWVAFDISVTSLA